MATRAATAQSLGPDAEKLVGLRRGVKEILHLNGSKTDLNPGSNDSEILRTFADELLSKHFGGSVDSVLNAAMLKVDKAQGFEAAYSEFRSVLRQILNAATNGPLGRVSPEQAAIKVLLENTDDRTLLRVASIFLLGNDNIIQASFAADHIAAAAQLDTSAFGCASRRSAARKG